MSYVRRCPFCSDHPAYLPEALQCVPCGAARPKRTSTVTYHVSCLPEAQEAIQDALDRLFHSAAPENGKAFLDLECIRGHFRISNAGLSMPKGKGGFAPVSGAALVIAQTLAAAGIPVVAAD